MSEQPYTVREINRAARQGSPFYCHVHPRNPQVFRVYQARVRKGVFQVRVVLDGREMWTEPAEVWKAG